METENIIYFDKPKFERFIEATQSHIEAINVIMAKWHELTTTTINTKEELNILLTAAEPELKTLAFDKLTKSTKETTLFGMKIKKEKAFDLLELPDLSTINAEREALNEIIKLFNQSYDIEAVEVEKGKATITKDYPEKAKQRFTIIAETEPEKIRLKGCATIVNALQYMQNSGVIDVNSWEFMNRVITTNPFTKEISYKNQFVKTGN
jgi:hypothetical protein